MKSIFILAGVAAFGTSAAFAAPQTRTNSYDGPRVEGSRTVTRDRDAGTRSVDAEATRKSDGATASRTYDRVRTEDGVSASGSSTGFNGKTRSFDYDRTRTENGVTASGTATGRNGETYTYSGNRARTETGYTANQNVRNGAGETVFNRDVVQSRANGQVNRSVNTTRAEGFRRPARAGRRGRN